MRILSKFPYIYFNNIQNIKYDTYFISNTVYIYINKKSYQIYYTYIVNSFKLI